jgi:raffinose/stachyose/melibiose transport system substrate-binding protein
MYFVYLVDRIAGPSVFESAATRTGRSFEDPAFVQAGTTKSGSRRASWRAR